MIVCCCNYIIRAEQEKDVHIMDARVRYTRKAIREAVLELLKEKSSDRITVKEICEKAQINRATFYKHYDNTYDLLEKLEGETLDVLEEKLSGVDLTNLRSFFGIVLQVVRDNSDYYEIMFAETGDRSFRDRMFALCLCKNMEVIKRFFPALDDSRKTWLYYFFAEGITGVMRKWMSEGYRESVDEVVDFLVKMVDNINYSVKTHA